MLKCQDCGKEDESVKETFCPFDEEINDKKTPVVICDECYEQRWLDT